MDYEAPKLKKSGFNCPHCGTYAMQVWSDLMTQFEGRGGWERVFDMAVSRCDRCSKHVLWANKKIVYPDSTGLPRPGLDLNEAVKKSYVEAAAIFNKSPRGSAALLRLAIQQLCEQLGEKGDLNDAIGKLVKRGLPTLIQKALDIVRVIGNEAVHPGQIDVNDNEETAAQLFDLVNIIAQVMITNPNQVDKLYSSLPPKKLKQIEQRDKSQ